MSGAGIEHRWSFSNDMHRTYAFLFQTIDTLRVQMSPDLWQLVYNCVAARDRSTSWVREQSYTRRHMLASERKARTDYRERMTELRENEIQLDAPTLDDAIRRQEKAIRFLDMTIARNRLLSFEPPTRTEDPHTGSSFEVQSDGFYCSVHAFNNIARSVLFAPPDMLSAIECTRTLDERCASPEDVMLMALREGIFLLQLKLTDIDDADQLTDGDYFPSLLEQAGGMLIYQPSGYGTGHYVPLVRIRNQWLIFSTSVVIVRSNSASDALHTYIAYTCGIEIAPGQSAHAARAAVAAATASTPNGHTFLGLLPLPLDCLWASAAEKQQNVVHAILTRTLLRRALSEWHLRTVAGGAVHRDIWTPTPLSPCAIEEFGWVIRYEEADAVVRCTGFETINLASFMGSRHAVYRELNRFSEELVHSIRGNENDNALALLRQMRSYLLASPAIDCLFGTPITAEAAETDGFDAPGVKARGDYAYALMSNRRWLRLVTLVLATSTLLTQIESVDGDELTDKTQRVLVLISVLAYTNMTSYGVPVSPELRAVWSAICTRETWELCLPFDSMSDALRDSYPNRANGLAELCAQVSYDASLWLLRSVAQFGAFPLSMQVLNALAVDSDNSDMQVDDNRSSTDQRCVLVGALRNTLFRLPMLGSDSDAVAADLHEQWCFEKPVLAEHNRTALDAFVSECARIVGSAQRGKQIAANVVDVLAFDSAYMHDTTRERPTDADDIRPRYLERAARAGFAHMHRRTFCRIDSHFDCRERAAATQNPERIEMPQSTGMWYTARVRDNAPRLAAAPLTQLQLCARSGFLE